MSRGRNPKNEMVTDDWKQIYVKSQGLYFQYIIMQLGKLQNSTLSKDNGNLLLQKIKAKKEELTKGKKDKQVKIQRAEFQFEKFFDIPKNWVWCKLGEITEFADNLNIHSNFSPETMINYIDIDSIDNLNFELRKNKLKKVSELSSRARRVLKKDYILYFLVRPYLNNLAIIKEDKQNYIGSTGFAVFRGVLINNMFIKYLLLSDYVRKLFQNYLSGFNSPSITHEQFISTAVPLPPLSEQKMILDFLEDLENKNIKKDKQYFNNHIESEVISLHESQILNSKISIKLNYQQDILKQLRQALLKEAMQGKLVPQNPNDEPASELLKRIKQEIEKLVKEKKIKKEKLLPPIAEEEIPYEIPKNWVWCRLGELCNYGSSNKADPKKISESTWVLDLEDIEKDTSKLLQKIVYSERKSLSTKSIFNVGDVLYSKLRPYLDKVIVADEDGVCTTEILPLKFYGNLNPFYMRFALKRRDFLIYVNSVTKGMKMPRLGTKEGEMALVPLAPISEQVRIVKKLDELIKNCDELEQNIRQSKEQTEQLLQVALKEALTV